MSCLGRNRFRSLAGLLVLPLLTPQSIGRNTIPVSCVSYHPLPRTLTLVSSWYGDRFQGRLTASRVPFDKNKNTAAHKELPLGTKLRLSYRGRSVVVLVNDRGPFVPGRDLDVSEAVASQLGFHDRGVARLHAEILGE